MNKQTTREERKVQLDAIEEMAQLKEIAKAANVTIKPGTSKDAARELILGAEFGPAKDAQEGTQDASGDTDKGDTAKQASDAAEGDSEGTEDDKDEEIDPLELNHQEIDKELGKLYDELVERIKAAKAKQVNVSDTDTPDQMRAGAVQFLRQCNATLEAAGKLVADGAKIVEQNNKQLQDIEKAKKSLEERSAAYRRVTNPETGEKNPGQA